MQRVDPGDTSPGTVTRLLADFEKGDRAALEAIFPIVYDELRLLAHRQRQGWNGDTTLGTTALVHEAYMKLVDVDRIGAASSGHFLRIAAMAMRQILCNHARDQKALKRGGDSPKVALDGIEDKVALSGLAEGHAEMLSDLDDALRRLEDADPRLGQVVECRFFAGLTIEDTAKALGTSPATVKRDWALARAWLFRELGSGQS